MLHRPLEDDARDILAKAAHGQSLDAATLAASSGISLPLVLAALGKNAYPPMTEIPDPAWLGLAKALHLDGLALLAIARGRYRPVVSLPPWLACIATRQRMLEVNAWVAACDQTGQALIIDTGADPRPLLGFLTRQQWKATTLLLTHDHIDHIVALPEIRAALPGLAVFSPKLDHVPGTTPLPDDGLLPSPLGPIRCLPTPGHTDGGTSYHLVVAGQPVCFVGDALFAGSIGGARFSYPDALDSLRSQVFSLPAGTILCPGHGPATTIALESLHNPFFVTGL